MDKQNSRDRDEAGVNSEEGQGGKSQSCLSPRWHQDCPPASCLDPLASAFFSLLYFFQASLAIPAFGLLGLVTCLDSLFWRVSFFQLLSSVPLTMVPTATVRVVFIGQSLAKLPLAEQVLEGGTCGHSISKPGISLIDTNVTSWAGNIKLVAQLPFF